MMSQIFARATSLLLIFSLLMETTSVTAPQNASAAGNAIGCQSFLEEVLSLRSRATPHPNGINGLLSAGLDGLEYAVREEADHFPPRWNEPSSRRWLFKSAAFLGFNIAAAPPAFSQQPKQIPPIGAQIRQYLADLATQWRGSGDPRKASWAPYVQDMSENLNLLPPNAMLTPVGVQPFGQPDGSSIINSTTGRLKFRLSASPDIWSVYFAQVASTQGRERQLLQRTQELTIEKEIGTLLFMQKYPQNGRNLKEVQRWIAANAASPEALTMEDLRNDPAMREAIKIYFTILFGGESEGFVFQADEAAREGPTLNEIEAVRGAHSWPPTINRIWGSFITWMLVLAPNVSYRIWREDILLINTWLANQAQAAAVSPEELFISRKAPLIEVVEGRATLDPNRTVQVPENPNATGFTPRFMSYVEDLAYYAPDTDSMLRRLEALRQQNPRRPQKGTLQTAKAEIPRSIVFTNLTAPQAIPKAAVPTPAPEEQTPSFWQQWKTVLVSVGGLVVGTGAVITYIVWRRSLRIRAEEAVGATLSGNLLEQWHTRGEAFQSQVGRALVPILSGNGTVPDRARRVQEVFARARLPISRNIARSIVERWLAKPGSTNGGNGLHTGIGFRIGRLFSREFWRNLLGAPFRALRQHSLTTAA